MASTSGGTPVINWWVVLLLKETFPISSTPSFNRTLHCFGLQGVPNIVFVIMFSISCKESFNDDPSLCFLWFSAPIPKSMVNIFPPIYFQFAYCRVLLVFISIRAISLPYSLHCTDRSINFNRSSTISWVFNCFLHSTNVPTTANKLFSTATLLLTVSWMHKVSPWLHHHRHNLLDTQCNRNWIPCW